jgi:hypothetical protein
MSSSSSGCASHPHTGDRQPDAVRLYEREGYTPIPIFPPYEELPFSRCFEKVLPLNEG